jgi:putative serine protease PepD
VSELGAARRGRSVLPALVGLLLAAIVGGVAGGLIVRATWGPGDGSGNGGPGDGTPAGATAAGASSTAAACPAASVADRALPSVETVRAGNGQVAGSGSGVVIRAGGYILTNDHVIRVAAGGGTLSILRIDGGTTNAAIVGRDPLTDVAVIRAEVASGLPAISKGESGSLRVGQPVAALGSPLGLTSTVSRTGGTAGPFVEAVTAVEVDGQPARSVDALIVKTLRMSAGDVVRLTYERRGASHATSLTLTAG